MEAWPFDETRLPTDVPAGARLRVASAADAAVLPSIDEDATALYAEHGAVFDFGSDPEFFAAEIRAWTVAAAERRVVLAEDTDGAAIGFAALGVIDGAPLLEQLSVRRSAMRRGIGSALLRCALVWSEPGGVLWLTTYGHLAFNRPFYASRGLVVVPESDCGPEMRALLAAERRALPVPEERVAMRFAH